MSKPSKHSRQLRDRSWEQATNAYSPQAENELFARAFDLHMNNAGNQDTYAALFYLLSSGAYEALLANSSNAALRTEEIQQTFRDSACELLAKLLQDIYSASIDEAKRDELVGITNELTPVALLNNADSVSYLASGIDDRRHKTDLYVRLLSTPEAPDLAIQAKSSDFASTKDIPKNGVLVSASDYGNEFLEVSNSLVSIYQRKESSTDIEVVDSARERILKTISLQEDRSLQKSTIEQKRTNSFRRLNRERPLNSHIGKNIPELIQLKKDLSCRANSSAQ